VGFAETTAQDIPINSICKKKEGQLSSVACPRKRVPGNSKLGGAPWVSWKLHIETIIQGTVQSIK